ncbi:MAG TPA: deoxyribonuclease IV [Patescibacteria group bacterium]|nr:deoxyribonuclease IV [Patescibacteria group bacterium]
MPKKKIEHMQIGCHVSAAGGIFNAPKNAVDLGCETFQVFSRSPHGGPAPKLTEEVISQFQSAMRKHGISEFVIHAPYILNFASAKPTTFHGSISIVRGELERGTLLGATYVMFHCGSFKDLGEVEGMKQVKKGLQEVLKGYEGTTQLLLENAAGAGSVCGDTFEELAEIMDALLKYKMFGGVCYDTQHGFASGYDMRTPEAVKKTFNDFEKHIGLKYLKMLQVNDSKTELGSHKDRHEHLTNGLIGEKGFGALIDFLQTKKINVPLLLETEHDKVKEDIAILKKLRNRYK